MTDPTAGSAARALADKPVPHNDAFVLDAGKLPAAFLATKIKLGVGKRRDAKMWRAADATVDDWINTLTVHAEGTKDGDSFLQGETATGDRLKSAMRCMYIAGLDVDCGLPMQQVVDRIRELGLLAVVYTTHSHMGTTTEISESKYLDFARKHGLDDEPDPAACARFLREVRHYVDAIAETAHLVGPSESQPGNLVIGHAPMERYRIIFFLDRPFVFADRRQIVGGIDRKAKPAEAHAEWKAKLIGLSDLLRVPIDQSCTEPARLFYLPRHKPGTNNHRIVVTGGRPLDLDTIAVAEPQGRAGAGSVPAGTDDDRQLCGMPATTWVGKCGGKLQIAQLLRDHCPERIRSDDGAGKIEVECPFDGEHSNPGKADDRGCFAIDAQAESNKSEKGGFVWHCKHNACDRLHDRLDMVCEAVAQEWFPEEALIAPDYVDAIDDGEAEAERDRLAKIEEIRQRIAGFNEDTNVEEFESVLRGLYVNRASDVVVRGEINNILARNQKLTRTQLQSVANEIKKRVNRHLARQIPSDKTGLPRGFRVRDGIIVRKDEDNHSVPVCAEFAPIGLVRSTSSDKWGLLIRFTDHDGKQRHIKIDWSQLQKDSREVRAELRGMGLWIDTNEDKAFTALLNNINVTERLLQVDRPGFLTPHLFVTPWGESLRHADEQQDAYFGPTNLTQVQGTLEGRIAAFQLAFDLAAEVPDAEGKIKDRFALGCLCGGIGTLVDYMRLPASPVINYFGDTTDGKTSAAEEGASVWGNPDEKSGGPLRSMDQTSNNIEPELQSASGAVRVFDDTSKAADSLMKEIERVTYKSAGGTGKGRMKRSGDGTKEGFQWRTATIITSEKSLSEEIFIRTGRKPKGGFNVRLAEIDFSNQAMIEDDQYKHVMACRQHFGQIGPEIVFYLFNQTPETMRARLNDKINNLVDNNASAVVKRHATVFALLALVGDVYKAIGVARTDQDLDAIVKRIWDRQPESAGTSKLDGAARAAETLHASLIRRRGGDVRPLDADDDRTWKEAVAWFKADGEGVTYYVPVDQIVGLAGGNISAAKLTRYLKEEGILSPYRDKQDNIHRRLRGEKMDHYLLRYTIEEEKPQTEDDAGGDAGGQAKAA